MIDDDTTVSQVVLAYLQRAGIDGEQAIDGPTGLAAAQARPPDAVILDLMLPGIDGLEVCRRLRAAWAGLPVLMLTARGEEEDRILGLEVGADDYVTKPFSPRELVLRVQSLLRRTASTDARTDTRTDTRTDARTDAVMDAATGGLARESAVFRDGDLVLDPVAHQAQRGGVELALTSREFDLLHWFLGHPGQAHDREALMRSVWGWEFGDRSTVTVHVRRLREKVETDPSRPTRLVTIFGVGYRWDPAPSREAPDLPELAR